MKIGDTVVRTSPDGRRSLAIEITSQKMIEHFRDLEALGFSFVIQPTVHASDNVCTACES